MTFDFFQHTNAQIAQDFATVDLNQIRVRMQPIFEQERFVLADWLAILAPLNNAAPFLDPLPNKLNSFHETILNFFREAKSKGELTPQLKQQLQEILTTSARFVCQVSILSEDVNALFFGTNTSDTANLLPLSLTNLLELEGFDKIFTDPPTDSTPPTEPTLVETATKTTNVAGTTPPLKPPPDSQKPQRPVPPIPDDRDFTQEKRRRVILHTLKTYGYQPDHWKGGHQILHHQDTRRVVVVPRSLDSEGTRKSVYQQAFESKNNT